MIGLPAGLASARFLGRGRRFWRYGSWRGGRLLFVDEISNLPFESEFLGFQVGDAKVALSTIRLQLGNASVALSTIRLQLGNASIAFTTTWTIRPHTPLDEVHELKDSDFELEVFEF